MAVFTQKKYGFEERGAQWYRDADKEIDLLHKKMHSEEDEYLTD